MAGLRRVALLLAAAGGAAAAAACGGPASAAHQVCVPASQTICRPQLVVTPGQPLLQVVQSRYGPILETDRGFTVYRFARDADHHSACSGPCSDRWPPLLIPAGTPLAGAGGISRADLSTFSRGDGTRQLAYRGIPLYTYSGDVDAGATYGEDVFDLGYWYVVRLSDTAPDALGPTPLEGLAPSPSPSPPAASPAPPAVVGSPSPAPSP